MTKKNFDASLMYINNVCKFSCQRRKSEYRIEGKRLWIAVPHIYDDIGWLHFSFAGNHVNLSFRDTTQKSSSPANQNFSFPSCIFKIFLITCHCISFEFTEQSLIR